MWEKNLWDYLWREIGVIRSAPLISIALLGVGAYFGYQARNTMDDAAIRELTATIGRKDSDVSYWKTRAENPPAIQVKQNPDGIYQFGRLVGIAKQILMKDSEGQVVIGSIVEAADLNPSISFQFRDYTLKIKQFGGGVTSTTAGHVDKSFNLVVCEIVGRAP